MSLECEEGIREGSKGSTYTCPQEASPQRKRTAEAGRISSGPRMEAWVPPTSVWISAQCNRQSPAQLKTRTSKVMPSREVQSLSGRASSDPDTPPYKESLTLTPHILTLLTVVIALFLSGIIYCVYFFHFLFAVLSMKLSKSRDHAHLVLCP